MRKGSCLVCGTLAMKLCSGCKTALYCNRGHQKQDWRSHKEYCVKVQNAKNTFDAILFAADEIEPRLVKIPWEFKEGEWHDLDRSVWFKNPRSFVRNLSVSPTLCFLYDDHFGENGSQRNGCIDVFTGGNPGRPWAGNILALRKGDSDLYDFFDNVDMDEDFLPLVRFFERYGRRG
ncbi:hypothetical protein M413DRAFT_444248 [Hebeloma cylindrosporum]|uniref:MYND-type domain-containing protein n=1 Tax=Hebeloma cylindrosporum TaxID=76867 RepID=A0A0C2YNB6_HEBCY|nr:hypothetical protein M413DRAFT_444248 [Hebeloma cylindrosporum h7]